MSVKGKVKRLNWEVKYLNDRIADLEYIIDVNKTQYEDDKNMLENLIKFFVVNQVGKPAAGGVHIDKCYIDKLNDLKIDVQYEIDCRAYVIRLREVSDEI